MRGRVLWVWEKEGGKEEGEEPERPLGRPGFCSFKYS